MKVAYASTRRQFGKVPTPLKVHTARLPLAFGLFCAKIGRLDNKLTLPPELGLLIREHVARITVCLFCVASALPKHSRAEECLSCSKAQGESAGTAGLSRPEVRFHPTLRRRAKLRVGVPER